MASTEAQKRASLKNYAKRREGCVVAHYFAPIRQHEALRKFAKKTGKTLETVTNEFITASLKKEGIKL